MASTDPRADARATRRKARATNQADQQKALKAKADEAKKAGLDYYIGDYTSSIPGFPIVEISTGRRLGAATGTTAEKALTMVAPARAAIDARRDAATEAVEAATENLAAANKAAMEALIGKTTPAPAVDTPKEG